jgi:hypothetical protein
MSTYKSGALLPAGIGGEIEPIMISDLKSIQTAVGGLIDVVTRQMPDGSVVVGYVHDEGLLLGMETNWFASAFFERELVGPCVVLGGTSPSGDYDGDDYDLPERMFQFLTNQFTQHVVETYNESMIITVGIELARMHGLVTDDDLADLDAMLEDVIVNDADDTRVHEWMHDIQNRMKEFVTDRKAEILVDEVEKFLEEQE